MFVLDDRFLAEVKNRNDAFGDRMWGAYVFFDGVGGIVLGRAIEGTTDAVVMSPEDLLKEEGKRKDEVVCFMVYYPKLSGSSFFPAHLIGCPFRRAIERDAVQYQMVTYKENGNYFFGMMDLPGEEAWSYFSVANPGYSKQEVIDMLLRARDGEMDILARFDWMGFRICAADHILTIEV